MTLVTGDGKASRLIIGSDTWVNEENAWIECEVAPTNTKTPIVMKYDSENGITRILGGANMLITNGGWTGDLITLPLGYHFTSDISLPLLSSSQSNVSASLELINGGRTVRATITKSSLSAFSLVFGSVDWGRGFRYWTTSDIEPD